MLTRLEHLEVLGLSLPEVRKSIARTVEALDAVAPAKRKEKFDKAGNLTEVTVDHGGAPDWPNRLRASEQIHKLADIVPRPNDTASDPSRPIAVNIILTGSAANTGAELQTHGVRLHLSGHNGDSA